MKSIKLVLSVLFLFSFQLARSSHYAGGELTVSILQGNKAVVSLMFYRITGGAQISLSGQTYYFDNLSDTLPRFSSTAYWVSTTVVDSKSSFGVDLEKYIFRDTVTLNSSGKYHFYSTQYNNRVATKNGRQDMFFVDSEIVHVMNQTNQGLHFVDETFLFGNPLDFRSSNLASMSGVDSVVHAFIIPKTSNTSVMSVYAPFFDTVANPQGQLMHINPVTGLLTAKANAPAAGFYVYAVEASAYKNGVVVSKIVRDVVMRPEPYTGMFPTNIPVFYSPAPNFSLPGVGDGFRVKVGDTLQLDSITCHSMNLNGNPTFSWLSSADVVFGQNATMVSGVSGFYKNYDFSFSPDSTLNNTFHTLTLRVSDNVSTFDYSFWIYVDGDTTQQHIGAEMNASVNANQEATVRLELYHKANEVLPQTQEVMLVPQGGGTPIPLQLTQDTIQTISIKPTAILSTSYAGTSSALAAGSYKVVLESCCRVGGVLNYSNATNNAFYTEASFEVGSTASSTPAFKKTPLTAIAKDSLWFYNLSTTDLDGDSVYYSFTDVLSSSGTPVSGFTPIPGSGAHGIIAQSAGILLLNPSSTGTFAYNITAEAYKGGALVETVNREMLIEVLDSSSLVLKRAPSSTFVNGLPGFSLTGGMPFTLDLVGYTLLVPDSTSVISMQADGEPFDLANSNASFVVTNNKQGSGKKGTFSWTPNKSLKGQSFVLNIRVSDGQMVYDYAAVLSVDQAVGLEENGIKTIAVYPNPTRGALNLTFTKGGTYTVAVYSLNGQVLFSTPLEVNNGNTRIQLPTYIASGIYLLRIEGEGNQQSELLSVGE